MKKIAIIGGGAAGLMAAYAATLNGNKVFLFEKNEKLGKKIYITGKGRCNLSNYVDIPEFMNNVVNNSKFLFSALNNLSPYETYALFENLGLKLKVERGNRVFPVSDKASDVTAVLEKALRKAGVEIKLNSKITQIRQKEGKVIGVSFDGGSLDCNSVIICTGGLSYSSTGSDGDGYSFARKNGHTVTELKPSLVGFELNGNDFNGLQGLSLKNIAIKVLSGNKTVYEDFGEMLFTHYGVSGPIILSASCVATRFNVNNLKLKIDLKPAITEKTIDLRLQKEFSERKLSDISNAMRALLPKSLISVVLCRAGVNAKKNCSEITKEEREKIIYVLKNFDFSIKGMRDFSEAIVTSGGVNVKEINSKNMESKLVKGLFFAGEVLDVDAFTGGFNLQIAFSTGYLAGINA